MWQERKRLMTEIEGKRSSRLICYLTSDRQNASAIVAKDALPVFFNQLRSIGKMERLDVFVFTTGGDTLAAFGLGRLTREFSKWVGVLVPDRCLSAGTLFALNANEIFMTGAGTLSPIDPSVTTPLNPIIEGPMPGQRQQPPVSVESVAGFKSLLEEDWSVKSEEAKAQIFKVLADRVHPLALGDVYRRRQQIERLAHELMSTHRTDEPEVQRVIRTLTRELGSHDYPISRTEARKLMGSQIAEDDALLEGLVWDLYEDFRKELELGVPFNPGAILSQARAAQEPPPAHTTLQLAVIESAAVRDVYQHEIILTEAMVAGPVGPMKVAQQEIVRAGWSRSE